ncbi:MAG: DUF3638 domain-containing protein [Puniceicoccales bacterium]|jgi:hypothetical protein|nr:DUF3638 domain-containing protein [Puniceicoccales bacterium]
MDDLSAIMNVGTTSLLEQIYRIYAYRSTITYAGAAYAQLFTVLRNLSDLRAGGGAIEEKRDDMIANLLLAGCEHSQEELQRMSQAQLEEVCDGVIQHTDALYRRYVRAICNVGTHVAESPQHTSSIVGIFTLVVWVLIGKLVCYFTLSHVLDQFLQRTQGAGATLYRNMPAPNDLGGDLDRLTNFTGCQVENIVDGEVEERSRILAQQVEQAARAIAAAKKDDPETPALVLAPPLNANVADWHRLYELHCERSINNICISAATAKNILQHIKSVFPYDSAPGRPSEDEKKVWRNEVLAHLQISGAANNNKRLDGFILICCAAAAAAPEETNEIYRLTNFITEEFTWLRSRTDLTWGNVNLRRRDFHPVQAKKAGKNLLAFNKNTYNSGVGLNGDDVVQQAVEKYPNYPFMQHYYTPTAFFNSFCDNLAIYASDSRALKLFGCRLAAFGDKAHADLVKLLQQRIDLCKKEQNHKNVIQLCSVLELVLITIDPAAREIVVAELPQNLDEIIAAFVQNENGQIGFHEQRFVLLWGLIKKTYGLQLTQQEAEELAFISIDPTNGIYPSVFGFKHVCDVREKFDVNAPKMSAYYQESGTVALKAFQDLDPVKNPFSFLTEARIAARKLELPNGFTVNFSNEVITDADGELAWKPGSDLRVLQETMTCRKNISHKAKNATDFTSHGDVVVIDGCVRIDAQTGKALDEYGGECIFGRIPIPNATAFDGGDELRINSTFDFRNKLGCVKNGKITSVQCPGARLVRLSAAEAEKLTRATGIPTFYDCNVMIGVNKKNEIVEVQYLGMPIYEYQDANGDIRFGTPSLVRDDLTGKMAVFIGGKATGGYFVRVDLLKEMLPDNVKLNGIPVLHDTGEIVVLPLNYFSCAKADDPLHIHFRINNGSISFVAPLGNYGYHCPPLLETDLIDMCANGISCENREKAKQQLRTVISYANQQIDPNGYLRRTHSRHRPPEGVFSDLKAIMERCAGAEGSADYEMYVLWCQAIMGILACNGNMLACEDLGNAEECKRLAEAKEGLFRSVEKQLCRVCATAQAAQSCEEDALTLDFARENCPKEIDVVLFAPKERSDYFRLKPRDVRQEQFDMGLRIRSTRAHCGRRLPDESAGAFQAIALGTHTGTDTFCENVTLGDGTKYDYAKFGADILDLLTPGRHDSRQQNEQPPADEFDSLGDGETAKQITAWRRRGNGEAANPLFGSFMEANGYTLTDENVNDTLSEKEKRERAKRFDDADKQANTRLEKIQHFVDVTKKTINDSVNRHLSDGAKQKCVLGKYARPTVEGLIFCLLGKFDYRNNQPNPDAFIENCMQRFGLLLSVDDAVRLMFALKNYMLAKTICDNLRRQINALKNLLAVTANDFAGEGGVSAGLMRESFNALVDAGSTFRAYDANNELFFLVFECTSGLRMRQNQVDVLRKLFKSMPRKPGVKKAIAFLYEMMMGAGKTSVINVILGEMLADVGMVPLFVNISPLQSTMTRDMIRYAQNRFERSVIEMRLSQGKLNSPNGVVEILDELKRAQRDGSFVTMSNTSLRLVQIAFRQAMSKLAAPRSSRETNELMLLIEKLSELLEYIESNCAVIHDEVHMNLDPIFSLNVPFGEKTCFSDSVQKILISLFEKINTDNDLQMKIKNREGFSDDDLRRLVEKMLPPEEETSGDERAIWIGFVLFDDEHRRPQDEEDIRGRWNAELEKLRREKPSFLEELALLHGVLGVIKIATAREINLEYGFRVNSHLPTNPAGEGAGEIVLQNHQKADRIVAVVPYVAANTPSTGEYAHPLERLVYAMLAHMQTPVQPTEDKPINIEFFNFAKKALAHPKSPEGEYMKGQVSPEEFDSWITSYNNQDTRESTLAAVRGLCIKLFSDPGKCVKFTFALCNDAIRVYSDMIQGTSQTQAYMSPINIGCSGTIWNKDSYANPFRVGFQQMDATVGVRVSNKVVRDIHSGKSEIRPLNLDSGPFNGLFSDDKSASDICAIIDAAGVLKDLSGKSVAQAMQALHIKNGNTKYGVYIFYSLAGNGVDVEGWYALKGNNIILLPDNSSDTIARLTGCARDQHFVYFDQSHCVGVDFQLAPSGRGLLTVSQEKTTSSKFMQAALRLRNFLTTQTIDICLVPQPGCSTICHSTPKFFCDLMDCLIGNERSILRRRRLQSITEELMEVARRTIEEEARWFFRIFRWLISNFRTVVILGWFYRRWMWYVKGCAEFSITSSPFKPTEWYAHLKREVKAVDYIEAVRFSIEKRLGRFGLGRSFRKRTATIVERVRQILGNERAFVAPLGGATQTNAGAEQEVDVETNVEQEYASPDRFRGSAVPGRSIEPAAQPDPQGLIRFLFNVTNEPKHQTRFMQAIISVQSQKSQTQALLDRRVPKFDTKDDAIFHQIPSEIYNVYRDKLMRAQVPKAECVAEMKEFSDKLAAIYEKAQPRNEQTIDVNAEKARQNELLQIGFQHGFAEYFSKTYDYTTQRKVIEHFAKFAARVEKLCAGVDERKSNLPSGQKVVNPFALEDLLSRDDAQFSVLRDTIREDFPEEVAQKIITPLLRIITEGFDLSMLLDMSKISLKDEFGAADKAKVNAWIDGDLKPICAKYILDTELLCDTLKACFNAITPPFGDDAAQSLAELILLSATKPGGSTPEQVAAFLGTQMFGDSYDPNKSYCVEVALGWATFGGVFKKTVETLDGVGGFGKKVAEFFQEVRQNVAALGGKPLNDLMICKGNEVVNATQGITQINAWIQQYNHGSAQIFPEEVLVTQGFAHLFSDDNDPLSPDTYNGQFMLITIDGRIIFLSDREADDYCKLINNGYLIGAHIYDIRGDRIASEKPPGETAGISPKYLKAHKEELEKTDATAKQGAMYLHIFNGTLTWELFEKNPQWRQCLNKMSCDGRKLACEFAAKSRQDSDWIAELKFPQVAA